MPKGGDLWERSGLSLEMIKRRTSNMKRCQRWILGKDLYANVWHLMTGSGGIISAGVAAYLKESLELVVDY